MSDFFYNFGYYLIIALPLLLIIWCLARIQKNRAKIKKMQEENKKEGSSR